MSPEDLERTIANPDFISGIYNYCDRWCERCSMTDRCATFAIEKLQDPEVSEEDTEMDEADETFSTIHALEKLEELFRLTIRMIQQTADDMGLDLDLEFSEPETHEDSNGDTASQYLLPQAKEYANVATKWFDHASKEEIWPLLQEEWQKSLDMNLPGKAPLEEAEQTKDAFEVINWYQFQIQVKLQRASRSLRKAKEEMEPGIETEDANGSAKVALIGLDRSISAWAHVLKILPEEQDSLLPILSLLSKIRRKTEETFPKAREFKRPGFDS